MGRYGVLMICPAGGQHPAGLSAARVLAALRAYLMNNIFSYYQSSLSFFNSPPDRGFHLQPVRIGGGVATDVAEEGFGAAVLLKGDVW
jgi:hypothetical protein